MLLPRVGTATDLDFLLHLLLEARPDNLALTGLESIGSGWDRPDIIRHREKNELLVDEVRDREAGHLTSVSLPSLVEHTNKREEELMVELQAEREKYAKVVKEKSSLEQELEGLSQALFEEVFLISIKNAQANGKLTVAVI